LVLSALAIDAGVARADSELASACAAGAPQAEPCRSAIARAAVADALALTDSWVAARNYDAAQQLLEQMRRREPRDTRIAQRLQQVSSLAEEAAWLARRGADGAAAASAGETALAEIRCTRLSGETALAACDQLLGQRPGNARILAVRGDLLLTLGRTADALVAYRTAAAYESSPALTQKIALAEATVRPVPMALDQQLLALARAQDLGLISRTEYDRQRAALLALPGAPPAGATTATLDLAALGRYHALVIGNNAYRHLERLETAVNDARSVGELLRSQYGFDVRLLTDATRADIVETLDEYRERLGAGDNLLVYYAGHGWLDAEADKGFWLPVDAQPDKRTQWVSNDTVRDALRALKAKHVLVVADSCFSGALTRGATVRTSRGNDYLLRMSRLKARQVLSSGGLEPVADSAGDGHSPFAAALIQTLQSNQGILDATTLFAELRRPVALRSDQVPQFADIRMAGHEGGDFLFARRR